MQSIFFIRNDTLNLVLETLVYPTLTRTYQNRTENLPEPENFKPIQPETDLQIGRIEIKRSNRPSVDSSMISRLITDHTS